MSAEKPPVVDSFGRVHDSLRVSVTDRCNIRCFYCMPERVKFLPHSQVLTFEEITRFVEICADLGVKKIRVTGGEPLVRSEIWTLVEMIAGIHGIEQVAMTTNGLLLAQHASRLCDAGLQRLNISLDSLDPEKFEQVTRRRGLDKVLEGIEAAIKAGFEDIRLNAIAVKGMTETEIVPLAKYAREKDLILRFIEFMPLDADGNWQVDQVLYGSEIIRILESDVGLLKPIESNARNAAVEFQYTDGGGKIGLINSVSEPFCSSCNRMRLTSEGKFMNCLFAQQVWDMRSLLRSNRDANEIEQQIRESILAKKAGHGTDSYEFERPVQAMYQIGG